MEKSTHLLDVYNITYTSINIYAVDLVTFITKL